MNNGKSRYVFPSCAFPKSMGELTIQKYCGGSIERDLFFFKTDLKELQLTCKDSLFSGIVDDSLKCLTNISADEGRSYSYLTASINNKIIGVCSYGKSHLYNAIFIYYIVVHPLISRLGGSLITWIVQESVKQNFLGRVVLNTTEGSASFYKRLGFIKIKNAGNLQLDPATSDDWYLINGKYKLKDKVNFKK
jgi:hypothetical protein